MNAPLAARVGVVSCVHLRSLHRDGRGDPHGEPQDKNRRTTPGPLALWIRNNPYLVGTEQTIAIVIAIVLPLRPLNASKGNVLPGSRGRQRGGSRA